MKVMVRGTVTIDIETCKGCELCIAACPPGVLVMSEDVNQVGYRYPRLVPGCTGCLACQQLCPDFCFEVFKYDRARPMEVPDSGPEPPAGGRHGPTADPGGAGVAS